MTTAAGSPGAYHRVLGFHAPARNRLVAGLAVGFLVGAAVALVAPWEVALLAGWDAAAGLILAVVWHMIATSGTAGTAALATREDETRTSARLLLLGACLVSLVGVAFTLHWANDQPSDDALVAVAVALLTVVLSWTLVNTVFTLHYAHLYYADGEGGVDFGPVGAPDFRDFAYLAFTIGMTYQVSDTMLTNRAVRRTALRHALLSYIFGVVIIAMTINIIASYL